MKGFEGFVPVEELYLSHNEFTKMEGLSTLANLRVLDFASKKLTSIEDIEKLTSLDGGGAMDEFKIECSNQLFQFFVGEICGGDTLHIWPLTVSREASSWRESSSFSLDQQDDTRF